MFTDLKKMRDISKAKENAAITQSFIANITHPIRAIEARAIGNCPTECRQDERAGTQCPAPW